MDPREVPFWGVLILPMISFTPTSSVVVNVLIDVGVSIDRTWRVVVSVVTVLPEDSGQFLV
jgi:hypothetical protein